MNFIHNEEITTMTKKVITAAAFLAASTMLANAASVLYTFNLETNAVPSGVTANINCNDGRESYTQGMNGLGNSAQFSFSGGNQWQIATDNSKNPFENISTLASNNSAKEILQRAGLNSSEIIKITQGVGDGNGTSSITTYAVTGLTANATYTVTMIIGGSKSGGSGVGKISWDTGTLVSGKYAFGDSAETLITNTGSSLVLSSLSAVELTITADSSGEFNIKLYNNASENSGSKTGLGLFAISSSAIPEPSAFGLLAGLGAIALAVSRRRRRSRR